MASRRSAMDMGRPDCAAWSETTAPNKAITGAILLREHIAHDSIVGARSSIASAGGEDVGKHLPVEAIPLALKALLGVVFELQLQEVTELRIRGFDLLA